MNHPEIRIIIVVIYMPKEIEKPKDQDLLPKNGFQTYDSSQFKFVRIQTFVLLKDNDYLSLILHRYYFGVMFSRLCDS